MIINHSNIIKTSVSVIIFFFCIGCKKENPKPLKRHNPNQEIVQFIKDSSASSIYDSGVEYYKKGDYKTAKDLLKKALEFEKNPIIYNELGIVEFTEKDYAEAIDYFKNGQQSDSTYWFNYINESRIYIILEQYTKAEQILINVRDKSDSDYWYSYANWYLAIVYNRMKQCKKAKECLSESELLKQDSELTKDYEKISNKIKKTCSEKTV